MIYEALRTARWAKEVDSKIRVILGGPHPSALPEEVLADAHVDAVCVQEGEFLVPELYAVLLSRGAGAEGIKGLVYKNDKGEIMRNPPRELLWDLDSLPFPLYDAVPVDRYFRKAFAPGLSTTRSPRSLPLISSRGCPYECTFCQHFMGRKFRMRSARNVVDEIEFLTARYGIRELHIMDDNFTMDKKRVLDIAEGMRKRNLRLHVKFPNGLREDTLDEELMATLKEMGVYNLHFGIESGSQRVLDLMKKHKTVEDIKEKVLLAKRMNFSVSANFIFGTPGETRRDMEETIKFALSLPLDDATFGMVTPYPGTEVREIAKKANVLVHSDYSSYTIKLFSRAEHAISTKDFTSDDLRSVLWKAYLRFHFRPKNFLRVLAYAMSWRRVAKVLKSLKGAASRRAI
jgi:radical SAM superfamily enzyme YgiQ (UPF0313 family)